MGYTVVIATLGGTTLQKTIECLNSSTLPPDEILICIPESEASWGENLDAANVKVIITAVRGQVAQRAIGFQMASNHLVLQIDDDMLPEQNCIEILMSSMKETKGKAAISPLLTNVKTRRSVYRKSLEGSWLSRLYYWLLNGKKGYQPGTVLTAGVPLGIDEEMADGTLKKVEWLPGGCVLHKKENLVTENFFPYRGKAYCEDLIHSYCLHRRGVDLYVDTSARCAMEVIDNSRISWSDFLCGMQGDLSVRTYYMNIVGKNRLRTWPFYVTSLIGFAARRLLLGAARFSNRTTRTTSN